ncbi:hypothetical protein I7I51_02567 [Histoplasma capsulatum]|uniref:Uncharacterized protein n=1 Tax=Ajellomyces capsulatus TaxID=5037 RepID=A0A8A1MDY2_AJECA|nr:hypothetical protein I7I51_02567 [Histoplasma capsulatum]
MMEHGGARLPVGLLKGSKSASLIVYHEFKLIPAGTEQAFNFRVVISALMARPRLAHASEISDQDARHWPLSTDVLPVRKKWMGTGTRDVVRRIIITLCMAI